jgi:hypothetical protein
VPERVRAVVGDAGVTAGEGEAVADLLGIEPGEHRPFAAAVLERAERRQLVEQLLGDRQPALTGAATLGAGARDANPALGEVDITEGQLGRLGDAQALGLDEAQGK